MCDVKILIVRAIAKGKFSFERYLNGGSYFGTQIKTVPTKYADGCFGFNVFIGGRRVIQCNYGKREIRVLSDIGNI